MNGYKEYFKGNIQLLNYERVRICLRKKKNLDLILTEIPENHSDKYFPPKFDFPPNQSFREQFEKVRSSSPFFWYSPNISEMRRNGLIQEENKFPLPDN